MTFTAPELKNLLSKSSDLTNPCQGENEKHRQLASLLEVVTKSIAEQVNKNSEIEEVLRDSLLGAYFYVIDKIEQEYYLHSPEYKSGRVYSSGSPLYSYLKEAVEAGGGDPGKTREKLIYMNEFYQFLNKTPTVIDGLDKLLPDLRSALVRQLSAMTNDIAKVVNAVPVAKAVSGHTAQLAEKYTAEKQAANKSAWFYTSKPNKKRIFLSQLATVVSKVRCEDENDIPEDCFSRSQRIKMGALLYIIKSIENEYYFRSAKNSELYRECCKIMNMQYDYNLDDTQQLACLSAFQNYINDSQVRASIEEQGQSLFGENNALKEIDSYLTKISETITGIQSELGHSIRRNWPATSAFATLGMFVGAAPGYGAGSVLGLLLGEGRHARPASDAVAEGVRNAASAYYGYTTSTTGYYAFVLSDFFVSSTLSRGFAKLFELIGMAIGGVAGGAIGFTVDLTYKSFQELCVRYLNCYDKHPEMMRNADPRLVRALLLLPAEIFELDRKNRICQASGMDVKQDESTEAVRKCVI